ncbi:MAG: hypothetical protein OMM_12308, partial [Candidatus Magnetoglobus multicellularis str. Araruama]
DDLQWTKWVEPPDNMYPYDLAIYEEAEQYTVYVTDIYNHHILIFDTAGNLRQTVSDLGLNYPKGIDLDANNYLYVADSGNHRVVKLNLNCQKISDWTIRDHGTPSAIAIDREKNWIYVSDTSVNTPTNQCSNRIYKYDNQGNFLDEWRNNEMNEGPLNSPDGLAVHHGIVYVANKYNHNILMYDSSGKLLDRLGQYGLSYESMYHPTGITVGKNGALYISDGSLNRIQSFMQKELTGVTKAIIVAGRLPENDYLWQSIKANANFAHFVLNSKGITKDQIRYFNPETIDLDLNDRFDDIAGDPTKENLQKAIEEWSLEKPVPDSLILYLVDHGESNTFVGCNDLKVSELTQYLNHLVAKNKDINIYVINDSCKSGSFIDLQPSDQRIVMTSTDAQSNAKMFLNGNFSFSMYFWSSIFQNQSIGKAYKSASESMATIQNPQIVPEDINLFNKHIGNKHGDDSQSFRISRAWIENEDPLHLRFIAEIDQTDVIVKKVRVYIDPTKDTDDESQTIYEMQPDLLLHKVDTNRYEGSYTRTHYKDENLCLFIAEDMTGNLSIPVAKTTAMTASIRWKAILIGSQTDDPVLQQAINTNIKSAYQALHTREYLDEDIHIMHQISVT